ncbi:hypothetical protein QQX98_003737 [Neonectria punicea]|uniref:Zn(2)-C6 fungal-type domain-containing protein n=1 Tax=Neonectria punicea TaxID=979145 RepID=A0ABR1HC26_9HYPO
MPPPKSNNMCAQCRGRNVRCDGSPNPCSNCHRLNFTCSFLASPATTASSRPERRRGPRACVQCRSPKSRCSGDLPSCAACRSRAGECVYPDLKRSARLVNRSPSASVSPAAQQTPPSEPLAEHGPVVVSPGVSWTGSVSTSSFTDPHRSLPLPPIRDQLHLINDFFRHVHPLPLYGFLNEVPVTQRCLSGQPMPQLADLVDEFAKSLQQLDIPAYSLRDLERYSTSRWLVRYITVHLSWHQTHCDVCRLFLSGYREAAPAIAISAFSPEYIVMSAGLCLHYAQAMISTLTDWANISFCRVTAHYDIAVCRYHACRLILFLSRLLLLPTDRTSRLMSHPHMHPRPGAVQASSHAAGEPEHRRDSSDPDDDTTQQPRFAVTVQRHKRRSVHSVPRSAGFVDNSVESVEAPQQAPADVVAPVTTQPTMLNPASEMDTSAFESPIRALMTQTPLENGPQFGIPGESFNLGLWDTWLVMRVVYFAWDAYGVVRRLPEFASMMLSVSCYGAGINSTPNLDLIANEGMRFDHCYVTNSICTPSRAAVLCGTHNHVNGVVTLDSKINKRLPNVAKQLRASAANYQTAMIGKWHLGEGEDHEPTGFDHWSVSIDWMQKRDKSRPFFSMCHRKAHRSWEYDSKYKDLYEDPLRLPDTFTDDYKNRANAAKVAKMRVAEDLTYNDLGILQPEGPRSQVGEKMIDMWWWQDRKIPAPEDVTSLKLFCKESGEAFIFKSPKELAEWKF